MHSRICTLIIPPLNMSEELYEKEWKLNEDIYKKNGRYVTAKESYIRPDAAPQ
jgi:hypothetical protein